MARSTGSSLRPSARVFSKGPAPSGGYRKSMVKRPVAGLRFTSAGARPFAGLDQLVLEAGDAGRKPVLVRLHRGDAGILIVLLLEIAKAEVVEDVRIVRRKLLG